jgi:outer membrane immunogenic protein
VKIRLLLAAVLIAASASSAAAADAYFGLSAGVSIFDDTDFRIPAIGKGTASYDTGYGLNLSGGYSFDRFRVEGEIGYKAAEMKKLSIAGQKVDITDTDLTVLSLMINGYYDLKNSTPFTPFIGAGIGPVVGIIDSQGENYHDTVFGYQAMAGVSYNIADGYYVDLSYRFHGIAGDLSVDGMKGSYHSNNVLVGLRSTF